MNSPLAGDLYERNVTSAAHTLAFVCLIANDPDASSMPTASASVQQTQSQWGSFRLERERTSIILDVAPTVGIAHDCQGHSYRLSERDFPGSSLFLPAQFLPHRAHRPIVKTIESFGSIPSLSWHNDGRMKHGILTGDPDRLPEPVVTLAGLVEQACEGIAALLGGDQALHLQTSALGSAPSLRIVDRATNAVVSEDSITPTAVAHMRQLQPYLSHLPETLFLRPDADNPNTIMLQPMALSFKTPADRAHAITRLASIFIRLRLLIEPT